MGDAKRGSTHTSRWSAELAQRWPFGLGALFFGVLIPIVAGIPDPSRRFGVYRSEVTVAIVTIAGFGALLLVIASIIGRRRRELLFAGLCGAVVLIHPALHLFFDAQVVAVDVARFVLGAAAVATVAAVAPAPGSVRHPSRRLAGSLAAAASVVAVAAIWDPGPWVTPTAILLVSCAAVVAGAPALLVGQRVTDGALISVGLLALSIGFGGALELLGGSTDLSVGLATVSVVGAVLSAAAAFIAVFEALDRREADREARELARSLELARLSARSARLEEVAHDQRSSLVAIEAAARRLRHRPSDDLAAAVATEAARLLRMLRGTESSSALFGVGDALDPMLECLSPLHGQIEFDAEPGVTIWGHRDDVLEIVRTLMDNAHEHGHLPVRVAARRKGAMTVVSVTDQGAGVPPALHESIFERGVTTKPRRHTGLGLFIARRLAREAGGDLRVARSDPATFELLMPGRPGARAGDDDRAVARSGGVQQLTIFDVQSPHSGADPAAPWVANA